MGSDIDVNSKILTLHTCLDNYIQDFEELLKFVEDISKELNLLRDENLKCCEIIQNQNLALSELCGLLIKIKDIDNKKFHSILKSYDIDLSSISEHIH